jgi:hypothetical protein
MEINTMRILKILLILIVIFIPSNLCGEINLTIEGSALIMEGSQSITMQTEMEVFNVTDNGGEAFRVTDGGGQNFNVRI